MAVFFMKSCTYLMCTSNALQVQTFEKNIANVCATFPDGHSLYLAKANIACTETYTCHVNCRYNDLVFSRIKTGHDFPFACYQLQINDSQLPHYSVEKFVEEQILQFHKYYRIVGWPGGRHYDIDMGAGRIKLR